MAIASSVASGPANVSDLQSMLFQRLESLDQGRVFVLLDQSSPVPATDPLHPAQLSTRRPLAESVMIARKDLPPDPDTQPRLLSLREPGDCGYPDPLLLQLTLGNALARRTSINGSHVCGWLVSNQPLAGVACHLQQINPLREPSHPQSGIAAWFHPHRLALAGALESMAFRDAMLGNIDTWLFVDAAGTLQSLRRSDDANSIPGLIGLPAAEHWAAQARVKNARQVLMAMKKGGHEFTAGIELKIDQALRQASEVGMVRVEDAICFALNQVTVSPHWHRHPAASGVLARAARKEVFLSDGLQALPAHTLNDIAGMADRSPPAAS